MIIFSNFESSQKATGSEIGICSKKTGSSMARAARATLLTRSGSKKFGSKLGSTRKFLARNGSSHENFGSDTSLAGTHFVISVFRVQRTKVGSEF